MPSTEQSLKEKVNFTVQWRVDAYFLNTGYGLQIYFIKKFTEFLIYVFLGCYTSIEENQKNQVHLLLKKQIDTPVKF